MVLALAACGGQEGGTTTSGPDTTTESETSTTAGGETTTTPEPTTTTAAVGGGTGEDCVAGTWVLDNEQFFEGIFDDLAADETLGVVGVSASEGVFTTTLSPDGTVVATRDDWGFVMETDEGSINITINGEQTGTWEVEGGKLLLALDDATGFDVEATVVVDGQEVPLPAVPEIPAEALSSASDFTCDGDTLTVESDGVVSIFNRS